MKVKIKTKKVFIELILLVLISISFLSMIPHAYAKSRWSYLSDFIINNRVENEGFANSNQYNDTVSYEATYYALKMLSELNILASQPDLDILKEKLSTNVETELNNLDTNSLLEFYYLLYSLELLDGMDKITSTQNSEISEFVNNTQAASGGFGDYNNTDPTVFHTYFAAKIHLLLYETETMPDGESHTNFVVSSFNSDGGYGGTASEVSSILSTYYAVLGVNTFTDLTYISTQNESSISYIMNFYMSDSNDPENYGGFSEITNPNRSMISTTFYCVFSMNYLDTSRLNSQATVQWILEHQNLNDGGFVDAANKDSIVYSSMKSTYYAFTMLKYFDPTLASLNENFWDVETNWFVLVFALLVIFTLIVAIGFYLWKRRQI